ncbi:MAG: glycosyltransferase family 4 protein [Fibrobacter sp.]|nr:glycosyltransferase family 4 protein [Fibrobacter sp.]
MISIRLSFILKNLKNHLFPPASLRRAILFFFFPNLRKYTKNPKVTKSRLEKPESATEPLFRNMQSDKHPKRVLVLDDRIPDPTFGAGFPRAFEILRILAENGFQVTFFPTLYQNREQIADDLERIGVEVIYRKSKLFNLVFSSFLKKRKGVYDIVIISRPHNMKFLYKTAVKYCPKAKIVYDAEAIFCLREIGLFELATGKLLSSPERQRYINQELNIAVKADHIFTVSQSEKRLFQNKKLNHCEILNHCVTPYFSLKKFSEREGILFIGSISPGSPNEDALIYFFTEILPGIVKSLPVKVTVVGEVSSRKMIEYSSENVVFTGKIDEIKQYYNESKLFISPHRIASGIPLKVCEASANGIPVVATPLIADQLSWQNGKDILIGKSPDEFCEKCLQLLHNQSKWEEIRNNAFKKVTEEYSRERFRNTLLKSMDI